MNERRLAALMVLFAAAGRLPMKAQDWTVVESFADGVHPSLTWNARIVDKRFPEMLESFAITLRYGSLKIEQESPSPQAETLAERTVSLGAGKSASLRLTRESYFSVEAIAHPPVRVTYILRLETQKRLRITQERALSIPEADYMRSGPASLESFLDLDWRDLIRTMNEGKPAQLRQLPIAKIAGQILESSRPLGEGITAVRMNACRLVAGGRRLPCDLSDSGILKVPAAPADSVILMPSFEVESLMPYYKSMRRSIQPLPSYAFMVLQRSDGSVREIGKPASPAGAFKFGPMTFRNYKKLGLEVSLPLQPPGDDLAASYTLLLRSGRPVEAYLDRGKLPPAPSLPQEFSQEQLVPEVVRHAASAFNPDDGSVGDLTRESLLDLLACAESSVNEHPELRDVCDVAWREWIEWERSAFARPLRSEPAGEGWTERDARDALDENWPADTLAARIRGNGEPLRELVYTKTEPPVREGVDTNSVVPHALAAAALARANPETYAEIIRSQLMHMRNMHAPEQMKNWTVDDIVQVGQCCKLTAGKAVDSESREIAHIYFEEAKAAAFRTFREKSGNLPLKQKVDIAHLFSAVWRPYYNMTALFSVSPAEPAPEKPLEQRMALGPGGRDITGQALEEARLRYKAALERAIKETKQSKKSRVAKKEYMERFLNEWYNYLFNVHKGGYLQPYEEQLQKDRKRALKAIQ